MFILFRSILWLKIGPALFYLSFWKIYDIIFPFFLYFVLFYHYFRGYFLSILISKVACCFQFSIVLHHSNSLFTTNYSIILVFLSSYIFSSIRAFYTLFPLLYLIRFNSFLYFNKKNCISLSCSLRPYRFLLRKCALSLLYNFSICLIFECRSIILFFSHRRLYLFFWKQSSTFFFSFLFDLLSFSLVWHNSYLLSPDLFLPKCLIDFSRTAISSYIVQSLWCASLLSLWLVGHNKQEELHNKQEKNKECKMLK